MADEPRTPPPAPRFLTAAVALPRIQAIVTNASAIWFSQIGYLAFITVSLLSVRDLDFFSVTARTSLPLLGVTIPTTWFFLLAPWLAAVLHVYFHLFLLKLWDAVAEAPPSVGSLPLGERVAPWLVVDWALRRRPDHAKATTHRPMNLLGGAATGFMIWLATPLIIAAFWWRSMSAHDTWLTLAIAFALAISLYASLKGWRHATKRLGALGQNATRSDGVRSLPKVWRRAAVAVCILLAVISIIRTQVGYVPLVTLERQALWLAPIYLANARIVEKPDDWIDVDLAERRFRIAWCRDRGLPPDACESADEPYKQNARKEWCKLRSIADCAAAFRTIDEAFDEEWQEQRSEYLANLTKPNLTGRELSRAIAPRAFIVGADLSGGRLIGANLGQSWLERANLSSADLVEAYLGGARLETANLSRAWLTRANLVQARLQGADLSHARLQGANLYGARLERADLSWARLYWANLQKARLEGAKLIAAHLEGADLREAKLQSVNWAGAIFAASPAHSADFSAGRNLTQSQLSRVIGDRDTILPLDAETGDQLVVWTCWDEWPSVLDRLLQTGWHVESADSLRAAWLCPSGVDPEPTGRAVTTEPAAPSAD